MKIETLLKQLVKTVTYDLEWTLNPMSGAHLRTEDIQDHTQYDQSCPTLCDPIDGSPPGSPIPGTLQARTLEWVANFLLQCMKGKVKVKSLSPTHSNPMDCSLPGSSAHGIFQARVLE